MPEAGWKTNLSVSPAAANSRSAHCSMVGMRMLAPAREAKSSLSSAVREAMRSLAGVSLARVLSKAAWKVGTRNRHPLPIHTRSIMVNVA